MNTTTTPATPATTTTTITNLAASIAAALGISRAESRRLAREILGGEWPTFPTYYKEGVIYLWKGAKDQTPRLFRLGAAPGAPGGGRPKGSWEYRSR